MSSGEGQVINLLLVDDHVMFRENLARSLDREDDFQVVSQASSSQEALSALNQDPHVVLLDVDLGAERALHFVEGAKKAAFKGQILIVTAGISGQEAVQLVQAGVAGIVHKQHSTQVLCGAIRKVAAGEACVEDEYVTSLFQSLDRTRGKALPKLTDRDRAVLQYVLEGLTNREIGEQLSISEGAVKGSLRQLFDKLGVRTRAQLVKIALMQYRNRL
jgi:two-component system nitrate/nitrite response regulator NarL